MNKGVAALSQTMHNEPCINECWLVNDPCSSVTIRGHSVFLIGPMRNFRWRMVLFNVLNY